MTLRRLALVLPLAAALAAAPLAPALAWDKGDQRALRNLALLGAVGAMFWASQQHKAEPKPAKPRPAPPPAISSSNAIYTAPVATAFNRYTSAERQRIQGRLKGWGYYRGPVDGAYGPATHAALAAYARDGNETQRLSTVAGSFALLDSLLF